MIEQIQNKVQELDFNVIVYRKRISTVKKLDPNCQKTWYDNLKKCLSFLIGIIFNFQMLSLYICFPINMFVTPGIFLFLTLFLLHSSIPISDTKWSVYRIHVMGVKWDVRTLIFDWLWEHSNDVCAHCEILQPSDIYHMTLHCIGSTLERCETFRPYPGCDVEA